MIAALVLTFLCGCIHNDLPYPRIQPNFTEFLVNGLARPAEIDTLNRSITLEFDEETDLQNVELLSFNLAPAGARLANPDELGSTLNLIRPLRVSLELYQEYVWTITARQEITRAFKIEGQIGQSVIDVPGRRVVIYVPRGCDLTQLKVTEAKLGSTASILTPDPVGRTLDFTLPVEFTLSDYGRDLTWTVYVEAIDAAVTLTAADAWSRVAWLYAEAEAGKENGFEYRQKGDEEWVRVPDEWLTANDGSFSARLIHLSPMTTYEARAFSGLDLTAPVEFTTADEPQLPNGSMDNWWLDGKVYNPWAEGSSPFWDTGNKGATTLGPSNSIPTPDTQSGTGLAAELKTEFKGIGALGKIAAGNIFTGVYIRTDGTNGILNFGREFSRRPTRLNAWFKYNCAEISSVGSDPDFADWKGRPDTCQIYIALTDWAEPLEIRTNPKNRQLFNPADPHVIAYGAASFGETIDQWTPLSIELTYRSTSRTPRYILVVCSASKYGDYFVGGAGSVLTIDDLQLDYDY